MNGIKRTINKLIRSYETSDGAGVKLKRTIGGAISHVDPFLLLDEFKSDDSSDYIAGFPEHPHRGFETVTYMLQGKLEHKDTSGNRGVIESGGIQWMTAGRGIVHSEMPLQENGLMWGFQLWINLPSTHKLCAPRYQDLPASSVPIINYANQTVVKVLAGVFNHQENGESIQGPVKDIITNPLYVDIRLPANESITVPLEVSHTAFIYPFEGSLEVEQSHVPSNTTAVLSAGDVVEIKASAEGARFLLVAALPLNEPVARRGPFVMNTQSEILQAYADFANGKFV